jgi:hypothetical protein
MERCLIRGYRAPAWIAASGPAWAGLSAASGPTPRDSRPAAAAWARRPSARRQPLRASLHQHNTGRRPVQAPDSHHDHGGTTNDRNKSTLLLRRDSWPLQRTQDVRGTWNVPSLEKVQTRWRVTQERWEKAACGDPRQSIRPGIEIMPHGGRSGKLYAPKKDPREHFPWVRQSF